MKNPDAALTIHADPCPELLVETGPEGRGVGSWVPQDKHRLVTHYLNATRHAWKNWPRRVLIDPFCGPGRIRVAGESFTRDGGAVAAWRMMEANGVPFTQVLLGDKDGARAQACKARLDALGAQDVEAFTGSADETILEMVKRVPRGALCFAYVDPYSLEHLSFSIIEALAPLKVDIAAHFSMMDLRRNADQELARGRFDRAIPGMRDDPRIKGANLVTLADECFSKWVELVRGLGFQHSKAMPLVTNNSGHGLYRLVFFARHDLPLRIWGDIAKDKNFDLFG